jgi:hypothetical protein
MTQSQIMIKLSLSYQSLLEAITSLELREMIQLKLLLDQKIQEALAKYEGTDDLIIKVEQFDLWVKFAGIMAKAMASLREATPTPAFAIALSLIP